MDCDTVFDGPQCPSCSSQSYFPLSRWVRPAMTEEKATLGRTARTASVVLVGSGVAFGLWKLFQKRDNKNPKSD